MARVWLTTPSTLNSSTSATRASPPIQDPFGEAAANEIGTAGELNDGSGTETGSHGGRGGRVASTLSTEILSIAFTGDFGGADEGASRTKQP